MGAICKESIRRSDTQLATKKPRVEPTLAQQEEADFHAVEDVAYASRPPSSSWISFSTCVQILVVGLTIFPMRCVR